MKTLFVTLLLVTWSIRTVSQVSEDVSLDGQWAFAVDSARKGEAQGWEKRFPTAQRTVSVPHTWNIDPATENYRGSVWYHKTLAAPRRW
ncbi:MAG TPA: hypothetical protein VEO56_00825, partial [Bacteroidota bacterium]|nr:hypothetical protein [Bacteroidota bacterium]